MSLSANKARFCIAPFVALNTRGDKTLRVCCSIKGMFHGMPRNLTIESLDKPELYKDDVYDLSQDSIADIWNSKFMRDLRMRMINEEYVPNCSHCHQLEDRGLTSKRKSKNKRYLDCSTDIVDHAKMNNGRVPILPKWWEIRLSTNCNLACRMCTPGLSSKIRSEFRKHFSELEGDEERYSLIEAERRSKQGALAKNEFFLNQIKENLGSIDVLEMRGGEVLSDARSVQFIKEISENPEAAESITFDLSSNVTLLNDDHIEMFNRFKGGNLRSSIDGFGEENDYIRHNSKWEDIVNALRLQKNLHTNWKRIIQITIQVYQVYTIDKLLWFIDELSEELGFDFYFGASTVRDTPHLLLEHAPRKLREESQKKIQRFLEESYLCNRSPNRRVHRLLTKGIHQAVIGKENPPPGSKEKMIRFTKNLDKIRNQSCLDIFPHLESIFKDAQLDQASGKKSLEPSLGTSF